MLPSRLMGLWGGRARRKHPARPSHGGRVPPAGEGTRARRKHPAGEEAVMRDQLLGNTQPVLSISLDSGESVVAEVGEFAWMTDSIEMAVGEAPRLAVYTAIGEPGVVAFASKRPGCILSVDEI